MSEARKRAIELVDSAKRRAVSAIEQVWEAYHDPKDGLKLREQQAAVAGAKVSSYIYRLAQFAQASSPRPHRPYEVFAAMCAYAEAKLKANHNVENLKEALPCWATYKTNILSGLQAGLDPNEYKSEWEFRKASMEARLSLSGAKEGLEDGGDVTKFPTKLQIEPARKFLRATSIANSLRLLLAQLVVEADYIKKGREQEAEEIVREARDRLAALVDTRAIKDPATKLAIESDVVGDTIGNRRVA